ncbi:MAG: hypothetical protein KAS23_08265 [Anaerohalosphaera sp.]|nr:hypothetical protein [Anaerohalosphaera sp.]
MTKKTTTKKAAPKKSPPKKKIEEPALKITSTSKCQTISGKSTLTYNVGIDDEDRFCIRIFSNTGGGFFSNEWVPLEHITAILKDVPVDHPVTSMDLFPLFKGKSVNTPGYLMAVLLNEKLLSPFKDTKRQFVYTGAETLKAKLSKHKTSRKSK